MEKVRIQDDLYLYVNGEFLQKAVIPDDKPITGGFADLDKGVEKLLIDDINTMCNTNSYPNELLKKACGVYLKALDVKTRNKLGIKPILKDLKRIDKINSIKDLNKHLMDFLVDDMPLPFNMFVSENMKDALHYGLYVQGPSLFLPDTTYYKEEMAATKNQLQGLLSSIIKEALAKLKMDDEAIESYIKDAFYFDELLAKYVKSNEEWSEYANMYNPMSTSKVNSQLKPLKFKKLLNDFYGFDVNEIIVAEPRFLKAFKEIFNEQTFINYKHWAYIKKLLGSLAYLDEKNRELGGRFNRLLTGVAKMPDVDKYAYKLASSYYSEPIGLYYGEKYFGEEAKKDVVDMVMSIIETYKKRVSESDILSEATKKKAVLKLSTMKVKMGYPDKCDSFYDTLIYNQEDSLYQIVCTLNKIKTLDSLNKLTKDVNRNIWPMPGNMVNACYNPFANDITFPAAILQAPFYSIKQTRSQNLGGIGAVIGHEISHAFDNNGAKFDENGNLNDWWTKEDFKKFKVKTNAMIKQFDGIELPQGKVNGRFIVSENIADNGGVAVTLDIMERLEGANFEQYFENWARVWAMKAKEEYLKLLLSVDVHGPKELRANMPPRNFARWYSTYNVTSKDKMYIAPNKRVVIW